ncbi:hypothetical protein I6A84_16895 [Frankia sp. CNm7]|uniref:hypothetical protein n=1 Tax=Frankia nepalensis TaxID=1836974 RepID=UPI001932B9EA|nr:hypothetical protein [Frankia nepalensis]MBL7519731.1 hypothetical protein [Frankia nepalensis]
MLDTSVPGRTTACTTTASTTVAAAPASPTAASRRTDGPVGPVAGPPAAARPLFVILRSFVAAMSFSLRTCFGNGWDAVPR